MCEPVQVFGLGACGGREVEEVAEDWEAWGSWWERMGVFGAPEKGFGEKEDDEKEDEEDGEGGGCEVYWRDCHGLVVGEGGSVSGLVQILF